MGFALSLILEGIYMHYFEYNLFNNLSFSFWAPYVDDVSILIDTTLHNINKTLNIMNAIDNNI